jgi:hypothetical protein
MSVSPIDKEKMRLDRRIASDEKNAGLRWAKWREALEQVSDPPTPQEKREITYNRNSARQHEKRVLEWREALAALLLKQD